MTNNNFYDHSGRRLIRELPHHDQPHVRLTNYGAEHLSAPELLAIVIGTADALDLAYDMLSYFGGLSGLATASIDEYKSFYGIGHQTAVKIKAALAMGAKSIRSQFPDRPRITSPMDAATIFKPLLCNKNQEHLMLALLDTRNYIIRIDTLYIGTLNSSVVRVAEVIRPAIIGNAAAIIIAHNHPSGDPSPSPEDVNVTRQIAKAAKLVDIELLDHIIIGNSYVSLKERGLGLD